MFLRPVVGAGSGEERAPWWTENVEGALGLNVIVQSGFVPRSQAQLCSLLSVLRKHLKNKDCVVFLRFGPFLKNKCVAL